MASIFFEIVRVYETSAIQAELISEQELHATARIARLMRIDVDVLGTRPIQDVPSMFNHC